MFEREIKKGIEFLNRINPGWVDKIDLDTLDMSSSNKCIIGQLYGDYWVSMRVIEKDYYIDRFEYGFSCFGFSIKTEEWKQAIMNIRSKTNNTSILDTVPNNQDKLYSKEEVILLLEDVMNIGMNLRQNQLNGSSSRSGREVLNEFIKKSLK